jgi:putative ABC transport system permease protein
MPCAWLVAERWLEGYEYRIDNSVWYYVVTALVVMLVGVIAISWQAVRLMRTNPVEALR